MPNLKFALAPMPNPDASQWNMGGVGSSGVGHVHFMYISCCLCNFSALATRKSADAKADSSGIQALVVRLNILYSTSDFIKMLYKFFKQTYTFTYL